MYNRYVNKIICQLLVKHQALGPVVAYFGRNEFGGRGSPHLHMMLKIKDAPIFGVDPDEKVIQFVEKYITTYHPTSSQDPILHELVKLQIHGHTKTCNKTITRSVGSIFQEVLD